TAEGESRKHPAALRSADESRPGAAPDRRDHRPGCHFFSSGRILLATGSQLSGHKEENMKKLSLIALAMLAGLISSSAWTKPPPPPPTSPRTYVSPSGDDYYGNPGCSAIANPCQTFNFAI